VLELCGDESTLVHGAVARSVIGRMREPDPLRTRLRVLARRGYVKPASWLRIGPCPAPPLSWHGMRRPKFPPSASPAFPRRHARGGDGSLVMELLQPAAGRESSSCFPVFSSYHVTDSKLGKCTKIKPGIPRPPFGDGSSSTDDGMSSASRLGRRDGSVPGREPGGRAWAFDLRSSLVGAALARRRCFRGGGRHLPSCGNYEHVCRWPCDGLPSSTSEGSTETARGGRGTAHKRGEGGWTLVLRLAAPRLGLGRRCERGRRFRNLTGRDHEETRPNDIRLPARARRIPLGAGLRTHPNAKTFNARSALGSFHGAGLTGANRKNQARPPVRTPYVPPRFGPRSLRRRSARAAALSR